jgi:ABC-2 type transport system ATP-binding protein
MEPSILIEGLTVRYGEFVAVDGLSLCVEPGEIFGLLGPNGAGKTTTFLCLTRQVPISAGRLRVLGHDVATDFDVLKPRFGYVPDVENHFDEFTAGQNLEIYADLYGLDRRRVDECLELVELRRERDLPVRTYSKGMRKKLLLARELLHRPALLLLDEPTANLDVHSTELIRGLLRDVARQGTTVFVTTHNMEEVEQICHRVAIINHGRLVDLDSPIGFKTRHSDRIVDVVLERDTGHQRLTFDLANGPQRRELAAILESEVPLVVHTREFDFREVFLRLTGEGYN